MVQATFLDFIHHKGSTALANSTMRRLANSGDLEGACLQNPRWNRGTINGVSTVLPGMVIRGNSNEEICSQWRIHTVEPTAGAIEPQPLPESNTVTQIPAESPVAPAPTPVPACSRWALTCKLKGLFS